MKVIDYQPMILRTVTDSKETMIIVDENTYLIL
jgi:hypothetical protein